MSSEGVKFSNVRSFFGRLYEVWAAWSVTLEGGLLVRLTLCRSLAGLDIRENGFTHWHGRHRDPRIVLQLFWLQISPFLDS